MKLSVEQFIHDVVACGLLTSTDLEPFQAAGAAGGDASRLARKLVSAGKLTKYQAANAVQGKAKKLVFGEYTILAAIGAGGMGQVFKAEHRRMKRVVALKILPPAAVKSPDAVKRFQQEVQAAARLEHPNIVAAHDAGEAHGVHFLVMQYVDGRDLGSLVAERGPLPVAQAVDYILQAARGLAYAHAKGVVHRDVKPANLLLNNEGTVKILDMGIARLDDLPPSPGQPPMTASGEVLGTVDFMAPEQADEAHQADARADVYSLGCTLHFLLTGESPYRGSTLPQKLLAHRNQPIPSLAQRRADVPPALDSVFARMVAKRPAERFQTMPEVVASLEPLGSMAPSAVNTAWAAPVRALVDGATTIADAPGDRTSGAARTVASLLDHEVVRKTWSATAKVTGALFATIIAPILVTLILKYFDKPQVEQTGGSVQATGGGTTEGNSVSPDDTTTGNAAKRDTPPAANLVPGKPVNLLAAIDPSRDVLRGDWAIRDGVLHVPESAKGHSSQLRLPIAPPSEYDLIVSLSRRRSNFGFSVAVVVDDRYQGGVLIDGVSKEGRYWGLEMIDGKPPLANGTRAKDKPTLSATPVQAVIKVRRGGVTVTCDGAPVFDWRGSGQQLSLPKGWIGVSDQSALMLVTRAEIDVHQITLVPGGDDWKPLWNKQDLDDWTGDDLAAWRVDKQKGELIGTLDRGTRWLHSQRSYGDFRLRLEFDMKPGTNAGIAVRAGKGDKEKEHLQLELCNDPNKCANVSTGTVHTGVGKNLNVPPASPVQLKPAGSWNELEMELYKNQLRVWLNGQWLHDLNLGKPAAAKDAVPALKRKEGRISLQIAGGQIRFRNLVIHEVKSPKAAPLRQAHAHNDFLHPHPLDDALGHGFCSVEADVFLVDGKLLVAHARNEVHPDRTLARLYLDPLRKKFPASGQLWPDGTSLTLLVDVKDEAEKTYRALAKLLANYDDIITTVRGGRLEPKAVTVVVSGNRARETIAAEKTRRVGIDGRLSDLDSDLPSHLMPMISENWPLMFQWRGEGPFPDAERTKLRDVVRRAHRHGRRLRFYATPESKPLWHELLAADVDLINTDDLPGLERFLRETKHP